MIAPFFTTILFLLPGIFIFFTPTIFSRLYAAEKLPLSIALSLSSWIIGFWVLRIIPIPFHISIYAIMVVSLFLTYITYSKNTKRIKHKKIPHTLIVNICVVAFFSILAIPGFQLAQREIAPTGQDMSMHAYLANIIYRQDAFPITMKPTVPVDRFGFYPIGFPTLIATLMHINHQPVHINSLWVTILTYWLFAASIYMLLRQRFSLYVSAVVTLLVSWASPIPHSIIEWGANPTVLSLDFIILAVTSSLTGKNSWKLLLVCMLYISAVLTHYILPIAAVYLVIPLLPFLYTYISAITNTKKITITAILCAIAISPVAWHLKSFSFHISNTTKLYVASLQQADLSAWQGAPGWEVFIASMRYILSMYSQSILLFYAFSILVIALSRPRHAILHAISSTSILVLIFNSRYWILPFSSVLYPDRVILLSLIPIGLGIAEGLTIVLRYTYEHFIIHTITNYVLLQMLLLVLLGYWFVPSMHIIYRKYVASSNLRVVTTNDIAAFNWLSTHTTPTDIIMNNYYDAGIWIPAIANRPITTYQTNPFDMDTFRLYAPKPAYMYIGNTSLIRLGNDRVNSEILNNPNLYTLVYQRGEAKIYRVLDTRGE